MWKIGTREFKSRLLLGTARYPNPLALSEAIRRSGAEIVTVSLRRSGGTEGRRFWDIIQGSGAMFLPNTAGCRSVEEAVTTARMARELFGTDWIKLEVVGDEYTLQPDPFALVEAARILIDDGFVVFPYMTEDLVVAERLVACGCEILMPWGAPIGSGQGLINPAALKTLRLRFPQIKLIVDAGIGTPSHAVQAMELGFDAVLLNSAVALSLDPPAMAQAFALGVQAGRLGYEAGLLQARDFAEASTPVPGTPFWQVEGQA